MGKSWDLLKSKLIERGAERGFKAEFARQMGLTPQAVQRYFSPDDKTVPNLDQADKMAAILGIELLKDAPKAPQITPQEAWAIVGRALAVSSPVELAHVPTRLLQKIAALSPSGLDDLEHIIDDAAEDAGAFEDSG